MAKSQTRKAPRRPVGTKRQTAFGLGPRRRAVDVVAAASASSAFPYVAVCMSVLHSHPNAPLAREAVKQRLGLEVHQWVTQDTAVVQARDNPQVAELFRGLDQINRQHNPYFGCVAFLIPRQQPWWLADRPSNLPVIVQITGRPPV